ncbi:hypothetical protein FF2_024893 [Malus domestica]
MTKYFIGSVLSGGGSVPAPKASAETWINLVNGLQKGSLSTRLGIPMIYGIDGCTATTMSTMLLFSLTIELGKQLPLKSGQPKFLMSLPHVLRSAEIQDGVGATKAIVKTIRLFKQ